MTPQERKQEYNRRARANDAQRKREAREAKEQKMIQELTRESQTAHHLRVVGAVAERIQYRHEQSPFLGSELLIY